MNIQIETVLALSLAHWIFDFVFQTHWMATNKSKSNKALGAHVGVYTIGMLLFGFIFLSPFNAFLFGISNGILHFCVDWVTSRCTARLYAKGDFHNFFVVIGFDQFIHLATMLVNYHALKGCGLPRSNRGVWVLD